MMQPIELTCSDRLRLFLTWGLYALGVTVVSQAIAARGFPSPIGWAVASAMGAALLVWTREI
jgi:hypothetical protein